MPEYSSYIDLFEHKKATLLEECSSCGLCLEACQSLPHACGEGVEYVQLQEELLGVLRGGEASPLARKQLAVCTGCGRCTRVCPSGLDPAVGQSLMKSDLAARKGNQAKPPPGAPPALDLQEVLCHMQLAPEEMLWRRQGARHADVVVYLGCNLRRQPSDVFAIMDILNSLHVDFAVVDGGELCCGQRHLVAGNLSKADSSCRKLISAIEAYGPKKVLMCCGTCYYVFKSLVPRFAKTSFEVQHLVQLLSENTAKLKFTRPVDKRIAPHDSCNMVHKADDTASLRKLIAAIPGARVVEMSHTKEQALCCGGSLNRSSPPIGARMRNRCLEEAAKAQAQLVVPTCAGCVLYLSIEEDKYGLESLSYVSLVARAMGLEREDLFKKFVKSRDFNWVMEQARPHLEAGPYAPEQVRELVGEYFSKLWISLPS